WKVKSSFELSRRLEGHVCFCAGYTHQGASDPHCVRRIDGSHRVNKADQRMQTEQPFHRCARKEPESVADALKVALLGDVNTNPDSPSNENVDAYHAYMQGRY